jgi:hypothetical protein
LLLSSLTDPDPAKDDHTLRPAPLTHGPTVLIASITPTGIRTTSSSPLPTGLERTGSLGAAFPATDTAS